MQGRLRPIQLSPFEVQSSYGGLVAGRHNLDLQDMRRVLDPALWLAEDDCLPHVGGMPSLGYMEKYEWVGQHYDSHPTPPVEAISWLTRRDLAEGFRDAWSMAHRRHCRSFEAVPVGTVKEEDEEGPMDDAVEAADFSRAIRCSINEAFCDGVNSGFYVNSYTTKPGPALAGLLDELRRGDALCFCDIFC